VEITQPTDVLGRSTVESIQSGLFFGHIGAIRQLTAGLTRQAFPGIKPVVVGTGGFARMFETEELFDEIVPELVLLGLQQAARLNAEPEKG
jgi:type III pantothenate kinase